MKKIKNFINSLFAVTFFQPFFEKLHYISLKGMNYGSANSPKNSGELAVLQYLSKKLQQNPVIFDVGSNNGQYLELLLKEFKDKNPVIHCFEPDLKSFKKLEARHQDKKNVILNNFALGNEEGSVILYGKVEGGIDSSLIKSENVTLDEFPISVRKLDNYCLEHNIKNIDFLKIDTEGSEMNVLRGAKTTIENNNIARIQLEHGSMQSIIAGASLYNYLQILKGYKMFHIKRNGIYKLKYSPKNEIFYNSNYYFEKK
jgi:FkbM family methyltransferase